MSNSNLFLIFFIILFVVMGMIVYKIDFSKRKIKQSQIRIKGDRKLV